MPRFKKFPHAKSILALIVLTLTSYFLFKTLVTNYKEVNLSLRQISLPILSVSLIFFILYFNFRALSWQFIIKSLGKKISVQDALAIWFLGESTRYLPGKVWSFISRAYLAEQKGISKTVTLLSLIVELFVILLVTATFSLPTLGNKIYPLLLNSDVKILLLILPISIIFLLFVINTKKKVILRILASFSSAKFLATDFLFAILCQILAWLFYGLAITILVINFTTHFSLSLILSNSVFSWLIGYASLVAPLGLGVRESATAIIFGPILGNGTAVLIALVARLIVSIAEVLNLGYWFIIRRSEGLRFEK